MLRIEIHPQQRSQSNSWPDGRLEDRRVNEAEATLNKGNAVTTHILSRAIPDIV